MRRLFDSRASLARLLKALKAGVSGPRFVRWAPVVACLGVFYLVNLVAGGIFPAWAYLGLGAGLVVSGRAGLLVASPIVLASIVLGEAGRCFSHVDSVGSCVLNSLFLLACAAGPSVVDAIRRKRIEARQEAAQAAIHAGRSSAVRWVKDGGKVTPMPTELAPVVRPEATATTLALMAKRALRCRTVAFCWYDSKSDTLVAVETISDIEGQLSSIPISLANGKLTRIKKLRDAVVIKYPLGIDHKVPLYDAPVPLTSVLAAPVHFDGQLTGCFLMDRIGDHDFSFSDKVFAGQVANLVADALGMEQKLHLSNRLSTHMSHLVGAVHKFSESRSLDAVYQTIVDEISYLSPFHHCILAHRVEPGSDEYRIVNVNRLELAPLKERTFNLDRSRHSSSSLAMSCVTTKSFCPARFVYERTMPTPFGVEFGLTLEDREPCLMLPLMVENEVPGFLFLAALRPDDRRRNKPFTKEELGPLFVFADYCTQALVNAESAESLKRQAVTDPQTGLANQRACRARLKEALERSARFKRPVSVLFCDVDKFKEVNDVFGHATGDVVLKAVAESLQSAARKVDQVARFGGEEFVAILEETPAEGALAWAERVRKQVSELKLKELRNQRSITVSIGIATFPKDADNLDDLLALADAAMYKAKNNGRNQCHVACP